jgi:prevent-host-death family protein
MILAKLANRCLMQVTIHSAKTNLSKLIEAALAGEEVVIAKGKIPVVKLVPVSSSPFKIGILRGQLTGSGPDFLEPMDEDELAAWEGKS